MRGRQQAGPVGARAAMVDGGVFDYVRADRALKGRLPDGDRVDVVAVDDATRNYWVATTAELIALDGDEITVRVPLESLSGELVDGTDGVTLRLRSGDGVVVATFRRHNKLTRLLAERLAPPTA